jgi:hypothetical protein
VDTQPSRSTAIPVGAWMGRVNRQPDLVSKNNFLSVFFTSFIGFLFYDELTGIRFSRNFYRRVASAGLWGCRLEEEGADTMFAD